jgi:hypothetical protein
MEQVQDMNREKQVNFRVNEDEAAQFDRVAAHYGLSVAAAIRMLIKERADALTAAHQSSGLSRMEHDVMWEFSDRSERASRGDIARTLGRAGYSADLRGLGRALNSLVRQGYLKRVPQNVEEAEMDRSVGNYHGSIYVPTPKGRAYVELNWRTKGDKERA